MTKITVKNSCPGFEIPGDIKSRLSDTLDRLNIKDTEVDLEFVTVERIQSLNLEARNINKPTDVLSFPVNQFQIPHNLLGSIVICPEIVTSKSEDMYSVLRHGAMHLAGYDHETDQASWDATAKIVGEVL